MSDAIQNYKNAIQDVELANREAEKLVGIIQDAGNKLQNRQDTRVDNVNIPISIEVSHSRSINAKDWPTAEQIAQALSAWHNARHIMDNAYRAIPEDMKGVVQPPPD